MKSRVAAVLSRCRTTLRCWLRFTWLSRLPLLGPRPWGRRLDRRAGRPAHAPTRSFRPTLEGLEGRWTPDDLLGTLSAPLSVGGLVLLSGNQATPLRLLAGGDHLTTAARPVPTITELADPADSSASGLRTRPQETDLIAEGDVDDLAFVVTTGQARQED